MIPLLLAIPSATGPIEAVCQEHGFEIARSLRAERAEYLRMDAKHASRRLSFALKSSKLTFEPSTTFFGRLDSPGFSLENYGGANRLFMASDSAPVGVMLPVPEHLSIVRFQVVEGGSIVQTCAVGYSPFPYVKLVGSSSSTTFQWNPVGYAGRSIDLGDEGKSDYIGCMMSITRWHNSESSAKFTYVDNIQRVAGREMVTKVDKDQNVYVDMNELSRHRGWNFTISLEPARADVRIGNDHIKIYPGADRIHINDELVTLPGTVPTQGYGVYLPLRLLQERGYLPSEG